MATHCPHTRRGSVVGAWNTRNGSATGARYRYLPLQSFAGIKKTHGTRSVPDFLSKNGPKWANLISNPQFSSALRAGGTGLSYVFRRNPVPYFLMPVFLNACN
eukprot:4720716-Prymnesium_polylepis.1